MNFQAWFALIGVGVIIFGLYKVYQNAVHKRKVEASRLWPKTSGTVISSDLKYSTGRYGSHHYWVDVTYFYSVQNKRYERRARLET